MKTPDNLKHKPIISVDNYDQIDGIYAGNSDAKALSIGFSQYDKSEISVKVFRNPNGKWSRQSEELPLHRNLDLTILILETLANKNISNFNKSISSLNDVKELEIYLKKNKNLLQDKIDTLKTILQNL